MTDAEDAVLLWLSGINGEASFWRTTLDRETREVREGKPTTSSSVLGRCEPRLFQYPNLVSRGDKVLDVGSGPLSTLGAILPDGAEIELHATDPLAPIYHALYEVYDIHPHVWTRFCLGENLLARHNKNSFKLVHANNSLDHSINPMQVIWNMLGICEINGFVHLRHCENEAEFNNYGDLHQWNFQIEGGKFIIWNKESRINVGDELGNYAKLDCVSDLSGTRIHCSAIIKKIRDIDAAIPTAISYEEAIYKVLYGSLLDFTNFNHFKKSAFDKYLIANKPSQLRKNAIHRRLIREIKRAFKKLLGV